MATTTCTGDCLKCNIMQRQYCASQITYNNMKLMEQMSEQLASVKQEMLSLKEKLDASSGSGEALINPIG